MLIKHPDDETTFEFVWFKSRQRYSDVYSLSGVSLGHTCWMLRLTFLVVVVHLDVAGFWLVDFNVLFDLEAETGRYGCDLISNNNKTST